MSTAKKPPMITYYLFAARQDAVSCQGHTYMVMFIHSVFIQKKSLHGAWWHVTIHKEGKPARFLPDEKGTFVTCNLKT